MYKRTLRSSVHESRLSHRLAHRLVRLAAATRVRRVRCSSTSSCSRSRRACRRRQRSSATPSAISSHRAAAHVASRQQRESWRASALSRTHACMRVCICVRARVCAFPYTSVCMCVCTRVYGWMRALKSCASAHACVVHASVCAHALKPVRARVTTDTLAPFPLPSDCADHRRRRCTKRTDCEIVQRASPPAPFGASSRRCCLPQRWS
jgi:hypothetical protein